MAVPKKRHSKSKAKRRKMHIYLEEKKLVVCKNCGEMVLSHIVCPKCGYYKGKLVLDVAKKKEKKERKKEVKKEKREEKQKDKSLNLKALSEKP